MAEWAIPLHGCGKGRALVVASEFDVRRIVGVEHDTSLCDQARENCPSRCEIQNISAENFQSDDVSSVHFFYQPFNWFVMSQVIANIRDRSSTEQRLVFVDPVDLEWLRAEGLRLSDRRDLFGFRIYIFTL